MSFPTLISLWLQPGSASLHPASPPHTYTPYRSFIPIHSIRSFLPALAFPNAQRSSKKNAPNWLPAAPSSRLPRDASPGWDELGLAVAQLGCDGRLLRGNRSFVALTRGLRGDVAQWGESLAAFMASSSQLQDTPFLPDVARLEWALHSMATLEDATPDLNTLTLLSTQDPGMLCLRLAPGTAVQCSDWPVATLHAAHGENGPSFEEVGRLLQARAAEDAVVWRQGFKPYVRVALEGEAALLHALLAGRSLGQALNDVPHLDVSQWLTVAVQSGLLLAVYSGE